MPNGAAKGAEYEREIAKRLSLWWSDGLHDDWLWRSSQSGGRATTRAKKGKTTENACGDLRAENPLARQLTDVITIEIKRGYNKISIADLLEKDNGGFHDFIEQAKKAASLAGTPHWMVIHKRDRRNAVVATSLEAHEPVWSFYTLDAFLDDTNIKNEIKRLAGQR